MPYINCSSRKGRCRKDYIDRHDDSASCRAEERPNPAWECRRKFQLERVLGVEVEMTLGDIRDELANAELSQ